MSVTFEKQMLEIATLAGAPLTMGKLIQVLKTATEEKLEEWRELCRAHGMCYSSLSKKEPKTKTPKEPKEPKTKTPKTKEPKTTPHCSGGTHTKHNLTAQSFITEEWARQWLVGAVPDTTNLYDVGGRYLKALWQLAKKGIWRVPEVGEKMNTGSLGSIPAIIGYLLAYRRDNTPKADDMYAEPGSE